MTVFEDITSSGFSESSVSVSRSHDPRLIAQSTTDISTFTDCELEYDDALLMTELLASLSSLDSEIAFCRNGYDKVATICETRQGELYKAVGRDHSKAEFAIKRTNKDLFKKRIAFEDGFTFVVSDNCQKEAEILKRVAADHSSSRKHIVQFVDFFESDLDYYLVMEYVESQTNLKQFIAQAKHHMTSGQLSIEAYQKVVKELMRQLFSTVQWLHCSIQCCHLNLCLESVLVENASFMNTKDGMIVDPNVSIKLCDFGVADLFENDDFLCTKQSSVLDNDAYSAPKVFHDEIYDGRSADNWKLGHILFQCMTAGQRIYEPLDVDVVDRGHWALMHGQLETYLKQKKMLSPYLNSHSFALLNGLLNVNEAERLIGADILKQEWFGTD
eukprot:724502_1